MVKVAYEQGYLLWAKMDRQACMCKVIKVCTPCCRGLLGLSSAAGLALSLKLLFKVFLSSLHDAQQSLVSLSSRHPEGSADSESGLPASRVEGLMLLWGPRLPYSFCVAVLS